MAQENITDAPLSGEFVKPQEPTKVYATSVLSATHSVGEEMIVHRALADKLIASGKATAKAPKAKDTEAPKA